MPTVSATMTTVTIDWSSDMPAHEQLAGVLRDEIAAGRYPVGSRLPSVAELESRFDVSPATLTRALRVLRDEKLIAYRQRRGHMVLRRPQ
jgi:DNA-binding GntR family transcriptional regulator